MIGYSVPSKKSIEYPKKYPALKYDIISCHVPENRIYSGIFYHMIYILYKSARGHRGSFGRDNKIPTMASYYIS